LGKLATHYKPARYLKAAGSNPEEADADTAAGFAIKDAEVRATVE
jgi:hypothetical protein